MISKTIFKCIDAHTGGNPVRVVTSPTPILKGNSMIEKRSYFLKNYDWIRKGLMFEPRGHDMMSGSLYYEAIDKNNDVGIIFIETSGCLPMCGHGLIGTVTVLIEEKLIQPKILGELRVETPAGLIKVKYKLSNSKVTKVKYYNVPSFLSVSALKIDSPDLGNLSIDVAYGGNFYAIIDIQDNFHGIENHTASQLIKFSRTIRKLINSTCKLEHPKISKIKDCSHILWIGKVLNKKSSSRNAVFYGDKAIDRSACGTGTSARMAQLFSKRKLIVGDEFVNESIIGSIFVGRIENSIDLGAYKAITPSIQGSANIIGHNSIIIDPEDKFVNGFQVI